MTFTRIQEQHLGLTVDRFLAMQGNNETPSVPYKYDEPEQQVNTDHHRDDFGIFFLE